MIYLYQKGSLSKLRKAQYSAFHTDPPGSWFERATGVIEAVDADAPILAMGLEEGRAVVFNSSGVALRDVKKRKVKAGEHEVEEVTLDNGVLTQGHRGWLVDLTDERPGCAPCVADVGGHRYAAGLMIVAGKGNTGKTPLIHALGELLSGDEGYACVRFGEPLSGYNTDFDELVEEVASSLLKHRVVVVDSLKDVLGAAGGNATSGGLSRGAFHLLSDLGAMASSRGALIIASLNPNSNDEKIVGLVNEAARSNSTSLVIPENENEWKVITRTGEGLRRLEHTLITSYGEHSVVSIVVDEKEERKITGKQRSKQVDISNEDYESVVRRMLK